MGKFHEYLQDWEKFWITQGDKYLKTILGIGNAGSNVVSQLSKYKKYRIYTANTDVERSTKYRFKLPDLSSLDSKGEPCSPAEVRLSSDPADSSPEESRMADARARSPFMLSRIKSARFNNPEPDPGAGLLDVDEFG